MQRILVSELKTGMITARNVFSADGRMMLAPDKEVTESNIRRLQELGVYAIYVRNPFFEDLEIPLLLSEETRISSMQTVKKSFEILKTNRVELVFENIQRAARRIVAEVFRNRQTLIHITDIRTHSDYIYAHSVDVCTLAVLTAIQLGYVESRLHDLAAGSLLHDIGMIRVDQTLLNKPMRLNEDEMALVRGHTLFGFELLRARKEKLSLPALHVSLQHHEKYNGSGYPRGLSRDEIHDFSRIVSITDVYDAITSDRPYRKALHPHEAYELMQSSSSQHFDPQILPLFLDKIAVYPIGAVLRLNTGDIGVVTSVPTGMQNRPIVRLIMDKYARIYLKETCLDMRNHLNISVDQVVDGKELFKMT